VFLLFLTLYGCAPVTTTHVGSPTTIHEIKGDKVSFGFMTGQSYLVGTGKVRNFDATPRDGESDEDNLRSVEGCGSNASLTITKEGQWIVTGRIGVAVPLRGDPMILNFAVDPTKPRKVLLFNKGHSISVNMDQGAVATLRGRHVQAATSVTFLLSDGNDSQFESCIQEGTLLLLEEEKKENLPGSR